MISEKAQTKVIGIALGLVLVIAAIVIFNEAFAGTINSSTEQFEQGQACNGILLTIQNIDIANNQIEVRRNHLYANVIGIRATQNNLLVDFEPGIGGHQDFTANIPDELESTVITFNEINANDEFSVALVLEGSYVCPVTDTEKAIV